MINGRYENGIQHPGLIGAGELSHDCQIDRLCEADPADQITDGVSPQKQMVWLDPCDGRIPGLVVHFLSFLIC